MERTPPQNLDAEKATLGSMMANGACIDDVAAILPDSEAFYTPQHRGIFRALMKIHAEGIPIDLITFTDRAKRDGLDIDQSYAIHLCESFAEWANAGYYAKLVRECWQRRRMIQASMNLADAAYAEVDAGDPIEICGACCLDLEEIAAGGQSEDVSEATAVVGGLSVLWENAREQTIQTGLSPYDTRTGGLARPSLVLIAARPSTGKTSLALRMALSAASEGVPALFVSIETSTRKICERLVAMTGGRSVRALRDECSPTDRADALRLASQSIPKNMIFIADRLRRMGEIAALSRASARRRSVGLIVIDHIQIMQADGRHENRNLEVASISAGLQALAKSTGACVLALSQLNRGVGETEPTLRSLRDSGALEQDADVVIFLHREHCKAGNTIIGRDDVKMIVAKNRDGPTFDDLYSFHAPTMAFAPAGPFEAIREEPVPVGVRDDDGNPF